MWKCGKFVVLLMLLAAACRMPSSAGYKKHVTGLYYKLISYRPNGERLPEGQRIPVLIGFYTQEDSLFWDSYNTFNDLFVIKAGPQQENRLMSCLSSFSSGDSLLLLVPAEEFFLGQFRLSELPAFCQGDSVIKVMARIGSPLSEEAYQAKRQGLAEREGPQISDYLQRNGLSGLKPDSMGVYWLNKPEPFAKQLYSGAQVLRVEYEGRFLSGRVFERSEKPFELYLNLPDQMVKGLNYVMHFLAEGQTAKIILPSPLAFGESGSSNGTVPPYTPVLYQITCIHVKQK